MAADHLLSVVAGVLGLAGLVGAAFGVLVAGSRKATIDWLRSENAEMRATIEFDERRHEQERQRWQETNAKLEGQLDAVKSGLVEDIVLRVLRTLRGSQRGTGS